MIRYALILLPYLFCVGCSDRSKLEQDLVLTSNYDKNLTPENFFISILNKGGNYQCGSLAELKLSGGAIQILPRGSEDYEENRPPAVKIQGLDVSDGIYVVPPHGVHKSYINISHFNQRNPQPRIILGDVRVALCKDLFEAGNVKLRILHFKSLL